MTRTSVDDALGDLTGELMAIAPSAGFETRVRQRIGTRGSAPVALAWFLLPAAAVLAIGTCAWWITGDPEVSVPSNVATTTMVQPAPVIPVPRAEPATLAAGRRVRAPRQASGSPAAVPLASDGELMLITAWMQSLRNAARPADAAALVPIAPIEISLIAIEPIAAIGPEGDRKQ